MVSLSFTVFFVSLSFISALVFMISFLLLIWGFVLSLVASGVSLDCLFEIFLVSRATLYCPNSHACFRRGLWVSDHVFLSLACMFFIPFGVFSDLLLILFSLHAFVFFVFPVIDSNLIGLWSEKMPDTISVFSFTEI